MSNLKFPSVVKKLFWGDDLNQLNWEKHQDYIASTILEKGNTKAADWLLSKVNKKYLTNLINKKKLTVKSANFWKIYLS